MNPPYVTGALADSSRVLPLTGFPIRLRPPKTALEMLANSGKFSEDRERDKSGTISFATFPKLPAFSILRSFLLLFKTLEPTRAEASA
jgi:hypothetical protein